MEVKTKFQLGDKVWALNAKNCKAFCFEIKSISCCVSVTEDCGYIYYNSDETGVAAGFSVSEKDVFGSKEELVDSIFEDFNSID